MIELNKIYCGDSLEVLKTFPDNCIDCCISSPPYYGLRDYGVEGQLGLEKTFHEYLNKLIEIYAEVKRVLKPTGTIWVNLGDSYSTQHASGTIDRNTGWKSTGNERNPHQKEHGRANGGNIQSKSLLNIPSRFAIKMTDELNLIQRNEIIWYKRNCMPSSAKDRFTVDFEKIYFFTKSKKYYFEQIFENFDSNEYDRKRMESRKEYTGKWSNGYNSMPNLQRAFVAGNQLGRNKRCVWDITTKPYKEAHFATFPEDLVKPMIQAGSPEFVCVKCGKAREKILEPSEEYAKLLKQSWTKDTDADKGLRMKIGFKANTKKVSCTADYNCIGYTTCTCNAGFTGGIVLDIFAGSGTTLKVAKDMGRNYIGIELNSEYIQLIEKRLELDKLKFEFE